MSVIQRTQLDDLMEEVHRPLKTVEQSADENIVLNTTTSIKDGEELGERRGIPVYYHRVALDPMTLFTWSEITVQDYFDDINTYLADIVDDDETELRTRLKPADVFDGDYWVVEIYVVPKYGRDDVQIVDYDKKLNDRARKGVKMIQDGAGIDQAVTHLDTSRVKDNDLQEELYDRVERILTQYIAEAYRNGQNNNANLSESQREKLDKGLTILENLTNNEVKHLHETTNYDLFK